MVMQPRGPYVQAALFCEKILREQDGAISIIRVIDRITHTVQAPDAPESLPPLTYPLQMIVMLKPGDATGRQTFSLTVVKPDGLRRDVGSGSVHFEGGPNHGVNLPI